MYPVVTIAGVRLSSWAVLMVTAFLVATLAGVRLARRWELDSRILWDVVPWAALGGLAGAKIYFCLIHPAAFAAHPLHTFFGSGMVWYGGLLLGAAAAYWRFRVWGLSGWYFLDGGAPLVALGLAIGRIGCFLAGDDYGLPTRSWVGVAFPHGSPPSTAGYLRSLGVRIPASIPNTQVMAVHPAQLYEAGLVFLMFLWLWRLCRPPLRPGLVSSLYLAMYSVERFFMEAIRPKDDRFLWTLSTSQIVSILLLGVAYYLWRRGASEPWLGPAGERLPAPGGEGAKAEPAVGTRGAP